MAGHAQRASREGPLSFLSTPASSTSKPTTGRESSDPSSGSLAFKLEELGPIGQSIEEIFQPKSNLDFFFAFEDEKALGDFHEQFYPKSLPKALSALPQAAFGPSFDTSDTDYTEAKANSLELLTDRWNLAGSHRHKELAVKVRQVRDEISSKGQRMTQTAAQAHLSSLSGNLTVTQPRPAQAKKQGAYFGLGAVAPGSQLGLSDWRASSSTAGARVLPRDQQDKVRFVFGVWQDVGNKGHAWEDVHSDRDEETRAQLFLNKIERFAANLGPRISAFRNWAEWCRDREPPVDHRFPSVVQLGEYLLMKRTHGSTAAWGARNHLDWWRVYVGVPIPTDNPALHSFKTVEQGHEVDDGISPQPWMLLALLRLAFANRGMVSTYAALFVAIAGACLRWRHVQRCGVNDVRSNAIIFRCTLGKSKVRGVRRPFLSPTPREWIKGYDLAGILLPFWERLAVTAGPKYQANPFLVPNVTPSKTKVFLTESVTVLVTPDSDIVAEEMKADKAVLVLRALLVEAGVPEAQAAEITLKSLRKFMATAADVFQLEPEQRNALGDWQDTPGNKQGAKGRTSAPMPHAYSGVKLETAYQSKKWIIAGVTDIADNILPPDRYSLSEFMADSSRAADIQWCTWEHAIGLNYSFSGSYAALVAAAGNDNNLGTLAGSSMTEPASPPGARKSRRAIADVDASPQSTGSAQSPDATRAKSRARPPLRIPRGPLAPVTSPEKVPELPSPGPQLLSAEEVPVEEPVLSGAESTEEETEDPLLAATSTRWFCQTRSKVVHFYRELAETGVPIPFCRMISDDESEEAPPQSSRDARKKDKGKKKRKRAKQTTYGEMPEQLGEGFLLLHAMGKRVCLKCIKKVPDSTAEFFVTPP